MSGSKDLCCGEGLGAGWDAFLAAVRGPGVVAGQHEPLKSNDVAVVADHDSGAVGFDLVAGDDDAAAR